MYRKYKGKFTRDGLRPFSAAAFLSDTESITSRPSTAMSVSNVDLTLENGDDNVDQCWRIIEQQCWKFEHLHDNYQSDAVSHSQDWKTVRIFVSSTFTDFHSEREILVKKVFPALKEWCECRKLHLVECDLRWGVPKDVPSSATVATCLEELDRCHQETGGEPFFISMLGERYGWIPSQDDLTDFLRDCYNWVPGVSITHMEILHGAYRVKNPNAVFFMRDPGFLENIPVDRQKAFTEVDDLPKQHLKVLKQKLQQNFPGNQIRCYNCHYAGIDESTGRKKVVLGGLDVFANSALEFFKDVLSQKYPNRYNIETLSQTEQEENAHLITMETIAQYVQGLEEEIAALMNFARNKECNGFKPMTNADGELVPLNASLCEEMELQGGLKTDLPPLCITGEAGIGKSVLAASFSKVALKEGLNLLYHYVGCTSESRSATKILIRIIQTLRGKDYPDKSALPENIDALFVSLKEQFEQWRNSDRQLVIVIDGINKVDDAVQSSHLSWLPVRFPRNICCILTVDSSFMPSMARLITRQVLTVQVQPLKKNTQINIIENYFRSYNKKLDRDQMDALVSKSSASLPLWLALACEELRVFGDFRMLNRKIQSLPEGLSPLLTDILNRLIQMDADGYISKVLRLIFCSLDGIPEPEVCRLLSDSEIHEPIPLLSWATVRRELKSFINSVTFGYNGSQKISFKHHAVVQAVEQLLLRSDAEKIYWHQYLAEYYQYYCTDPSYTFIDLPYHMYKGGLWKQMIQYYRTDSRSVMCPPFYRQKNLNLIRCKRHTPDVKNLSRPVHLCQVCSIKQGLTSPLSIAAKSACIVCGTWIVSHSSTETVGRVCIKHCGRFGPTSDQCFFCDRLIHGSGAMSTPGLLCNTCSYGPNAHKCAKLVESDSAF